MVFVAVAHYASGNAAQLPTENFFNLDQRHTWEGNFNDMALKTVIRRLLSKYGYLSIKMQSALGHDTEAENRAIAARRTFLTSTKGIPHSISNAPPLEDCST